MLRRVAVGAGKPSPVRYTSSPARLTFLACGGYRWLVCIVYFARTRMRVYIHHLLRSATKTRAKP